MPSPCPRTGANLGHNVSGERALRTLLEPRTSRRVAARSATVRDFCLGPADRQSGSAATRPVSATMQKPTNAATASSECWNRRDPSRRSARARSGFAEARTCRGGSRRGSSFQRANRDCWRRRQDARPITQGRGTAVSRTAAPRLRRRDVATGSLVERDRQQVHRRATRFRVPSSMWSQGAGIRAVPPSARIESMLV